MNTLTEGHTFRRRGIISDTAPESNLMETGHGNLPELKSGDIVFVPGATWNLQYYLDFLESNSKNGVRIYQLIHDLIPLVVPEHIGDDVPEQFAQWLHQMSDMVAGFIANSNATKADLLRFFETFEREPKPCIVVPLAQEFVRSVPPIDCERKPIFLSAEKNSTRRIHARVYNAARLPYVLCVGTIESRKNVWTLARIWLSIVEELGGDAPRLVFAGRHGILKEDFDQLIQGSGSANGSIVIVERPDDHELEYLYKNCLFSVFISYYEGWGLPIGESLSFGKAVVASNTSSMREVGGEFADYVDPADFHDIRAKIMRLITDTQYRWERNCQIAGMPLRSWNDVTDDLCSHLQLIKR
ncbi:MAG: glycosyl transferase group 1 [Hyphomicrobiales bacterium]|nr:glycosyl transferase group 1 [Hyphomicrobiales bacterium]